MALHSSVTLYTGATSFLADNCGPWLLKKFAKVMVSYIEQPGRGSGLTRPDPLHGDMCEGGTRGTHLFHKLSAP